MKWLEKLFGKSKGEKNNGFLNIFIILVFGVILLMFSNKMLIKNEKETVKESLNETKLTVKEEPKYEAQLEKRLEEIFSQIEGVGKVEVMITLDSSKEIILNKDTPYTESSVQEEDANGGHRQTMDKEFTDKTVLTNSGDGGTQPIILKETMPVIKGVVILAEAGDRAVVKQDLTKAAMILLDLSANKVQVCKLKLK